MTGVVRPASVSCARDVDNLLHGIGNAVQVLQAASAGIASLQSLVDSAKSIANQALQTAIADINSQATRASLVARYNNVLQQIKTTARNASFNGVNLLSGDQLNLVFNETGKSTLNITGVTFNPAGLGLSNLNSGTDFIDDASTNKVLLSLTAASGRLYAEASSLGSMLSIVRIRLDFSRNRFNVLRAGSSNLALADTSEEAAKSHALSTHHSIAVSALSLANQAQRSVLQLFR